MWTWNRSTTYSNIRPSGWAGDVAIHYYKNEVYITMFFFCLKSGMGGGRGGEGASTYVSNTKCCIAYRALLQKNLRLP